jgi:cytochrome P450
MNYHLRLHEHYGEMVRVGPNHVSISAGSAIPVLYSIASKFQFHKSDWYSMFDFKTPMGTSSTIFSIRDEVEHRSMKRPVASAYSLSTLKELEPMNDACSAIFMRKMGDFASREADVDLGAWVHWYAFDTITSITFSNRLDFMEQERDVEGIIAAIEGRLIYNSIIGQVPWLHQYLFGNDFVARLANYVPALAALNKSRYIVDFAAKQLQRYENKEFNTVEIADMLDRFKRFGEGGTQTMSDAQLLAHAVSNIFAGADTTAASLRSVFYWLCRTPSAHERLLREIDDANAAGDLSRPVTFAEAQNMKYLQTVIKEALRMHPAVGMLLERVVPEGGAEVAGTWLPGGVIVGM